MSEIKYFEKALLSPNIKAFQHLIAKCEGTDYPDGYRYIFGSMPTNTIRAASLNQHPRILKPFIVNGKTDYTDAAGRYQILSIWWDKIAQLLALKDFSEHSQDLACLQLLSWKNCVRSIVDGKFFAALPGASTQWASLPFNNYGQPKHPVAQCQKWYIEFGGTINDKLEIYSAIEHTDKPRNSATT